MQLELEPDVDQQECAGGEAIWQNLTMARNFLNTCPSRFSGATTLLFWGQQYQKNHDLKIINGGGRRTPEAFGWEQMSPSAITIRNSRIFRGKALFGEMQDAYPGAEQYKDRNILAAFMFTRDDVFKRIDTPSAAASEDRFPGKADALGANFLILDEPTNHLDMESKDILEQALNRYTGTISLCPDDRYFVNRTASRVLELSGGRLELSMEV